MTFFREIQVSYELLEFTMAGAVAGCLMKTSSIFTSTTLALGQMWGPHFTVDALLPALKANRMTAGQGIEQALATRCGLWLGQIKRLMAVVQ